MQRVLSTHLLSNHRLTGAMLQRIWQAGIPAVELFCARQHLDYRNPSQIAELGYWFRDSELKVHSVHAPMYSDEVWGRSGPQSVLSITETSLPRRIETVNEIKRAIEMAEVIPFRYLIQHIGVAHEEYDDRRADAAFTALEELAVFARQRGVEILLENIPNAYSSANRLVQFLASTHLALHFVFDVGHANMDEGVDMAYSIMQERIRSTHVHDNDGRNDVHLVPMVSQGGTVDWPRTMRLLASRRDQYPLVLELREPAGGAGHPIDIAKESFMRLESLIQ
ncbi:MAG: sugar phosphate isomerase/epimerase [Bryobacterales bacterium]|nr:sugar phosphate isomerase/epimerase [Bryobacterales bacterium]